MGKDLISGS